MRKPITTGNRPVSKTSSLNKKNKLKATGIMMAVLPLAACGGGGDGGGNQPAPGNNNPPPPPPPPPTPDFTENPTNVFVARDNNGRTLSQGTNTANLTVTGGTGSDNITTGSGSDTINALDGSDTINSGAGNDTIIGGAGNDTINASTGNDLIRAGDGSDNVDAGAGNDAIVLVGTTTANQYDNGDITNPAGSGFDLSSLISLADLNGRAVSEVSAGEVINGGTGTNTLYIYGTVDLTGVTLSNVSVLVVNSDVTLTPDQMDGFTTVNGDGTSTINIDVPAGTTYVIDLSTIDISNVNNMNISGNVTFVVDDASDLNGITNINTNAGSTVHLEINGNGGATSVNLGDIADVINSVDLVRIGNDVTLVANDASDITNLGLTEIRGGGTVDSGGNSAAQDALDNIDINIIAANSDSFSSAEDVPIVITFDQLLSNDISDEVGELSITDVELASGSEGNARIKVDYQLGTVTVTPDADYNGNLSLNYTLQDSANVTETGNISLNVTSQNDAPTGWGSSVAAGHIVSHDGAILINGNPFNVDGARLMLSDVDNSNSSITIRVESISGGVITKNGGAVTTFTYNDLTSRNVEFERVGNDEPTLVLSFSNDGVNFSNPTPVEVTTPIGGDIFTLTQGGSFGLSETIEQDETYLLEGEDKFFHANNVAATFTNHGQIKADGTGYITPLFTANVDTITNTGLIEATTLDDRAAPIYIEETGALVNSGLLRSEAPSLGIRTAFGAVAPDVTNSGTIYVTGANARGITHTSVQLDNSGVIYVDAESQAYGVSSGFDGAANIVNSGSILVSDNSDGHLAIGISTIISNSTIDNSGTLKSEVAISSSGSIDITNTGNIHGEILLSASTDTVDNQGTIFGNVELGGGNDTFDNTSGQLHGIVDAGAGNDTILGGAHADYFDGGSGNDTLSTGSAGADMLQGGVGDDTLQIAHTAFTKIDGGADHDILEIGAGLAALDLTALDDAKIKNIEEIDLSATDTAVTLSLDDVLASTDENNQLMITGENGDSVTSTGEGWVQGADQDINGVTYNTYTSGTGTLLVDEDITQTIN